MLNRAKRSDLSIWPAIRTGIECENFSRTEARSNDEKEKSRGTKKKQHKNAIEWKIDREEPVFCRLLESFTAYAKGL